LLKKTNREPLSLGQEDHEPLTTARDLLKMILEYVYRRPKYVEGRLCRRVTRVIDSSSGEVDYIVHFSDDTIIGMRSIKNDGKNERAYRRRHKDEKFTIVQVVIDTAKDLMHCVQDVLSQLAWHAQNIFGMALRRHKKPRQNGESQAKFRRMKQYHPAYACR